MAAPGAVASVGFCGLGSALGCSSLDPASDTWSSLHVEPPTQHPDAGLDAGSSQWSCLDDSPPPIPNPPLAGVAYVVPIVDFSSLMPVPMLKVQVCQITDYNCTNALPVPVSMPLADAGKPYVFEVDMPFGLNAFLRLTATDYLQLEYYFGDQLVGNQDGGPLIMGEAIPMLTLATTDSLVTLNSGISQRDPAKGILAVRLIDCNMQRAAGVSLKQTSGPPGIAYTLINNLPVYQDMKPTDLRGVAGFANLAAPSVVTVVGVTPDGRTYGEISVQIRANQLSVAEIRPRKLLPK